MFNAKKAITEIAKMFKVAETQSFSYGGKTWTFRRIGKVVFIEASSDIRSASAGTNTIGTLRESMRPDYLQRYGIANSTTGEFLNISTTGLVTLYMPMAVTSARNNSFDGCYIAGGGVLLKGSIFKALRHRRKAVAGC